MTSIAEINERNIKFWKEQDHVTAYVEAVGDFNFAMQMYEVHGHGRFIWEAYKHFRTAEKSWPAYKEHVEEFSSIALGEPRRSVSGEVVAGMKNKILPIVDQIFDDLLSLRETSDESGNRALKKALRIDGRKAPVNSIARATDTQIVESMMMCYRNLESLQERYSKSLSRMPVPPTATAMHIKTMVSNQIGVSVPKVDAVWRDYLTAGKYADYCTELIERCKKNDKEIRATETLRKTQSKRSPARPSETHQWRRLIKSGVTF